MPWHIDPSIFGALAMCSLACSASHPRCAIDGSVDAGALDAGATEPAVVEARRYPWPESPIRFLGLTDLGPAGGGDLELRWHVDRGELNAMAIVQHDRVVPDILELRTEEAAGVTDLVLRVAVTRYEAASLASTIGVRVTEQFGSGRWDVPLRIVLMHIDEFSPPPARLVALDGRVELELIGEPPVLHDQGAWIVRPGLPYRLGYRAHNRTDAAADVQIVMQPGDATIVEGALEQTHTIPAQGSEELEWVVRFDEVGRCVDCIVLFAGFLGEDQFSDGIAHFAEVLAD